MNFKSDKVKFLSSEVKSIITFKHYKLQASKQANERMNVKMNELFVRNERDLKINRFKEKLNKVKTNFKSTIYFKT